MQLKAQTRTHPSGSQSGRSAAIPLRSRSQTTLPRHPLPRSAQHLRALGPARYCSQACARGSSRSHACALLQPSARASSQASARRVLGPPAPAPTPARASSRALGAAPLPHAGSPAPALRPARARAAAREGGAEVDLGLDFSGEWNREQREQEGSGNNQRRDTEEG